MQKYRPDIDGLRAVAILPVLLFHSGYDRFAGGYVGVDIFFVISGYLITSIILRDLKSGNFSLAHFWERRARRILPAAFCVVLVTLIAGFFILLPDDLNDLGKSTTAYACFASNIYFWLDSDYFGPAAETKPFLHTWSLAVEEQFYFVLPFFLLLTFRFFRSRMVWLLAICILGSFFISLIGISRYPVATFYLLPSRAWELFIGAFLAFIPPSKGRRRNEVLSLLGATAIVYSICFYDNNTVFPGLTATLPCVGAGLIIWCNGDSLTVVGKFLTWRILVFIGLISYSLYLWHWPIFVYAKYILLGEVGPVTQVLLIALSFLLAWGSWKYIETPFRKKQLLASRPRIFWAASASLGLLFIVGVIYLKFDGFPSRLSTHTLRYSQVKSKDREQKKQRNAPVITKQNVTLRKLGVDTEDTNPDFLIWGDSHARALAPAFDAAAQDLSLDGWLAWKSGTVPLLGTHRSRNSIKNQKEIRKFNQSVLELVKQHNIKNVFLVSRWAVNINGRKDGRMDTLISNSDLEIGSPKDALAVLEKQLQATIEALTNAGATVWIVKQVPDLQVDVPRYLANRSRFYPDFHDERRTSVEDYHHALRAVNQVLDRANRKQCRVLDSIDVLAMEGEFFKIESEGYPLYVDDNHLSHYGAMQFRPLLIKIFKDMSNQEHKSISPPPK